MIPLLPCKDDRSCLWSHLGCSGRDDYQHLVSGECDYYLTKLKQTGDPVRAEAEFINNISLERAREFSQPLVLYSGGEEEFGDEVLDDAHVYLDNNVANKVITDLVTRGDRNRSVDTPNVVKTVTKDVVRLEQLALDTLREMCGGDLVIDKLELLREPDNRIWSSQMLTSISTKVVGTTRLILGGTRGPNLSIPPSWPDFLVSLARANMAEGAKIRNRKEYVPLDIKIKNSGTNVTAHINDFPVTTKGPGHVSRMRTVVTEAETISTEVIERSVKLDKSRNKITTLIIKKKVLVTEKIELSFEKGRLKKLTETNQKREEKKSAVNESVNDAEGRKDSDADCDADDELDMDQQDAWDEYELEYSGLEATGLSLEEPNVEEAETSDTQGEPALGVEKTSIMGSEKKSTR